MIHPGIAATAGPRRSTGRSCDGETEWGVTALRGERRDGRRRRLGDASLPDARRDEGEPLPQRGHRGRRRRRAARRSRASPRGDVAAEPLDYSQSRRARPAAAARCARPTARSTGARDDTATVLRKIRAADGSPGVRDEIAGLRVLPVRRASRRPAATARAGRRSSRSATARSARDRRRRGLDHASASAPDDAHAFKLPAAMVLGDRARRTCPRRRSPPEAGRRLPDVAPDPLRGSRAGRLPALPVLQRRDGHRAVRGAARAPTPTRASRPTRVIVLMGGPDFWSNGIHLNLIEASDASGRGVVAQHQRDGRPRARHHRHRPPAHDRRDAAATPAPAASFWRSRADRVCARDGVILNPHYKGMGNLYGSEYWTYLLPRRVGARAGARRSPRTGCRSACARRRAMGLIDDHFGADAGRVPRARSRARAARSPPIPASRSMLERKEPAPRRRRGAASRSRPIAPRSSSG